MEEVTLRFSSQINFLHLAAITAKQICRDLLQKHATTENFIKDVDLIISEACTNAIKHGKNDNPDQKMEVVFQIYPDRLEIQVKDSGKGFELSEIPSPNFRKLPENGYGLYLIRNKSDRLEYLKDADWNILKIIKYFQ